MFFPEGSVRPCSLGDAIALVSSGQCVDTGRSPGTGRISISPDASPLGFPVGLDAAFPDSGGICTKIETKLPMSSMAAKRGWTKHYKALW